MEELFKTSIIKGLIFSSYGDLGPQPVYVWPKYYTEKELANVKEEREKQNLLTLTTRDVTQISIKNLSLFISDKAFTPDINIQDLMYFAILPYPDFNVTSLTYFHYINTNSSDSQVPTAFSILVDENSRSFLYNNINRIKPIVI